MPCSLTPTPVCLTTPVLSSWALLCFSSCRADRQWGGRGALGKLTVSLFLFDEVFKVNVMESRQWFFLNVCRECAGCHHVSRFLAACSAEPATKPGHSLAYLGTCSTCPGQSWPTGAWRATQVEVVSRCVHRALAWLMLGFFGTVNALFKLFCRPGWQPQVGCAHPG
jgi:hypothetical protein